MRPEARGAVHARARALRDARLRGAPSPISRRATRSIRGASSCSRRARRSGSRATARARWRCTSASSRPARPRVQANATQMALGRCAQHMADHPEVVVVQPPRQPPPPPPPPPKWWRDPFGLGFAGAGVVGIGVGIGFIAASYSARHDAEHAPHLRPVRQPLVDGGVALAGRRRHARARHRADRRRRHALRAGRAGRRARPRSRSPSRSARAGCRSEARFDRRRRAHRGGGRAGAAAAVRERVHGPGRLPLHGARAVHDRHDRRDLRGRTAAAASPRSTDCAPSHRRYVHRAGSDADACVPAIVRGQPDHAGERGRRARLPAARATTASGAGAATIAASSATARARRARCPSASPAIDDVAAVAAGDAAHLRGHDRRRRLLLGRRRQRPARRRRRQRSRPAPAGRRRDRADRRGAIALAAGTRLLVRAGRRPRRALLGRRQRRPARRRRRGRPARCPRVVAGLSASVDEAVGAVAARLRARRRPARCSAGARTPAARSATARTSGAAPADDAVRAAAPPHGHRRSPPAATTPARSRADGLYCWGANAQGQVEPGAAEHADPDAPGGHGRRTSPIRSTSRPARSTPASCARATTNPVTCWGANDERPARRRHADREPPTDAALVAAGAAFSCALASDGALYCWGDNHYGQLAIGGDTVRADRPRPCPAWRTSARWRPAARTTARPPTTPTARARCSAGARTAAASSATARSVDAPARDAHRRRWQPIGIAAGGAHTCAFAADKAAALLGLGRLRPARAATRASTWSSPSRPITDLGGPEGGDGVFAVAAGASHTCVGATISASVLCFGLNGDGQLGNGTLGVAGGPDPVPSLLGKPKALAAGDAHTCALDAAA